MVGAVVITVGFYTVIWGKIREETSDDTSDGNNVDSSAATDVIAPLLRNKV